MDFSIRTATPAERMYSYSQSSQIEGQTGCIGHLRADFGSDGNSFYSSWADHNASLKDQAFKDEFDHLINTLRGLEAPDASQTQHEAILRDRAVLTSYCYRHPDSKRPGFYGRELTLRADTQKHAYILRLNPKKGDYNLYCYCYRKDWFDRHLNNAEKGIRFIDPNYTKNRDRQHLLPIRRLSAIYADSRMRLARRMNRSLPLGVIRVWWAICPYP